MFVVFCCTAHGMEIETDDSQKNINFPTVTVKSNNTSKDIKAILDEKEATEIEDLFKSTACNIFWFKVQCSCSAEEMKNALWQVAYGLPASSSGDLFIKFLRQYIKECLSATPIMPKELSGSLKKEDVLLAREKVKTLIIECYKLKKECSKLEEKKLFIIDCCNIIAELKHYSKIALTNLNDLEDSTH